jgi:tRNA pseudouridine38-40 synthase
MRRIHLILEYDGTNYAGWQRQANALSVQEVVERAILKLTGETVCVHGASRTDAGVHALGQSAHFDTESRVPADKFSYALNTILPPDVRVQLSEEAAPDFHARFSGKGKRYRYSILARPHAGALTRNTHAHVIYPLDASRMDAECADLVVTHDFSAFAASGSVVKDCVRTIYAARVIRDGDALYLDIVGSGFLYNMVRIIAGTLISVGSGRMEPGAFRRAIESGSRLDLGVTAPAHGLTLMEVFYDGSILDCARRIAGTGPRGEST